MADNKPIPEINGKSFLLSAVGIVALLLAFAVILKITYSGNEASTETVRNYPEAPKAAELRAKEAEVLNSYAWVDKGNGVVRIPVSHAMELVVQDLSK